MAQTGFLYGRNLCPRHSLPGRATAIFGTRARQCMQIRIRPTEYAASGRRPDPIAFTDAPVIHIFTTVFLLKEEKWQSVANTGGKWDGRQWKKVKRTPKSVFGILIGLALLSSTERRIKQIQK